MYTRAHALAKLQGLEGGLQFIDWDALRQGENNTATLSVTAELLSLIDRFLTDGNPVHGMGNDDDEDNQRNPIQLEKWRQIYIDDAMVRNEYKRVFRMFISKLNITDQIYYEGRGYNPEYFRISSGRKASEKLFFMLIGVNGKSTVNKPGIGFSQNLRKMFELSELNVSELNPVPANHRRALFA